MKGEGILGKEKHSRTVRKPISILGDRRAVSDVLGSILTLVITVTLFTAIFAFLYTLPPPAESTYVDIEANLEMPASGGGYINITHVGGETLTRGIAVIIVTINGMSTIWEISDSNSTDLQGSTFWETGEVWSRFFGEIDADSSVSVELYDEGIDDTINGDVLKGGMGFEMPVITFRGTDPAFVPQGGNFTVHATVIDEDDDIAAVGVFLQSLGLGAFSMNYNSATGRYESPLISAPSESYGSFTAIIFARDSGGRNVSTLFTIRIGEDSGGSPDLSVVDITYRPLNPTNGEPVDLIAEIENMGTRAADTLVVFYRERKSEETKLGYVPFALAVGERDEVTLSWIADAGGNQTIIVELLEVIPTEIPNIYPNEYSIHINILPNILIVDDDGYAGVDGSIRDTANYMEAALDGSGFSNYNTVYVKYNDNGPRYDGLARSDLKSYDIVIWMCGYEYESTLTSADRSNITEYLDNNGSLWLIGNGILDDADGNADFEDWLSDYIHVTSFGARMDIPETLYGNITHNITSGPPPMVFSTYDRQLDGSDDTNEITPDADPLTKPIFNGADPDDIYGLAYGDEAGPGEHVVFTPWEFTNLMYEDEMSYLAYEVILWLGNLTGLPGEDVAISQQGFDTTSPFFMQWVNVTAVIRNNGASNHTVEYIFYVDGEEQTDSKGTTDELAAGGGSQTVWWHWRANSVGTHVISVKADPYDEIEDETNENNNELTSRSTTKSLYVQYSILLVDDDRDDGTKNTTRYVADAFDELGYGYAYYNRDWGGISAENLSLFNMVIWVCGDTTKDTLTKKNGTVLGDQENITSFLLEHDGSLWLIGNGIFNDDGVTEHFQREVLQVYENYTDNGTPAVLLGRDFDRIAHGISADTDSGVFGGADGGDVIVPSPNATGIFWQNASSREFNGLRYDKSYKLVLFAFELGFINGSADSKAKRNEVVYRVMRWNERPDESSELFTYLPDVGISDINPVLGNAYVLNTTVYNHGDSDNTALVRFLDGDDQIGSDIVPISACSTSKAEIFWTPLYAGERTITVLVDPLNSVSELFEHNNNVTFQTEVYFFWDDMENGSANWEHENIILRLNGEGAIDDWSGITYTDIVSEWASYHNITENSSTYHSHDTSFHFEEDIDGVGTVSGRTLGIGNSDKNATTATVDLSGASTATLRFWHKYNILPGTNGAFVMVGYYDDLASDWKYIYASPLRPYTGNMLMTEDRRDDSGNAIIWCWNGVSTSGTFGWEQAEFDLLSYVPEIYRDDVQVKFNYTQYGGGTGFGWWVDDIEIAVTRSNEITPSADTDDLWNLTTLDSNSGGHAWLNRDPETGYAKEGIDNTLTSIPIDLTNARSATISANVKFNINYQPGYPPDGFRIEVSNNNGESWKRINLGVRSAWNLSGSEGDADNPQDTSPADGKSITGIDVYGDDTKEDGWVQLSTMSRIMTELDVGKPILIRFRLITTTQAGYDHYSEQDEFYGLLVDDVVVSGETIEG